MIPRFRVLGASLLALLIATSAWAVPGKSTNKSAPATQTILFEFGGGGDTQTGDSAAFTSCLSGTVHFVKGSAGVADLYEVNTSGSPTSGGILVYNVTATGALGTFSTTLPFFRVDVTTADPSATSTITIRCSNVAAAGVGGQAGGADTQVQFNNAGALDGSATFRFASPGVQLPPALVSGVNGDNGIIFEANTTSESFVLSGQQLFIGNQNDGLAYTSNPTQTGESDEQVLRRLVPDIRLRFSIDETVWIDNGSCFYSGQAPELTDIPSLNPACDLVASPGIVPIGISQPVSGDPWLVAVECMAAFPIGSAGLGWDTAGSSVVLELQFAGVVVATATGANLFTIDWDDTETPTSEVNRYQVFPIGMRLSKLTDTVMGEAQTEGIFAIRKTAEVDMQSTGNVFDDFAFHCDVVMRP